ncbi:MAG TPA: DAK2 domain-containing protein [Cellulomonas sp.]|nr:DAK2 domain-containing protein [Cellulomonas sp.]
MQRLDGTDVRAWAHAATVALGAARGRIDAVNVFPVADSDTGTNVLLTVAGGADAVAALSGPAGADTVARVFASGALLSARGNSGVILSQYLEGLAGALSSSAGPADLARALAAAGESAVGAVADPQEGTVLTLARVVADSALRAADAGADLAGVLAVVSRDAHAALARISAQHPVLAAAHVVDAGACALLVVLDALRDVIGRDGAAADAGRDLSWLPEPAGPVGAHVAPAGGGAFEVMLLVRTSGEPGERGDLGPALSTRMQELGDSVAVVGAEGVWQVHVHTDHPGRAVAAAALGAREQVVVRLLGGRTVDGAPHALGVVACTGSADLGAAHALAGAVTLVRCDGVGLEARHLVRAITDAGTRRVVVLPGDASGARAAREAARSLARSGTTVDVLDAHDELRVTVAVLALAGAEDPARRVAGATAVLARLRTAVVEQADLAAARSAVDALLAGVATGTGAGARQTLTILTGSAVDHGLRADLEADLARRWPDLAVLGTGPVPGLPAFWLGLD